MHYASWKLEGHQDTLDIPHNKEQLMDNVEQMSARNIPDLSRPNHVTNMLVVGWVCLPVMRLRGRSLTFRSDLIRIASLSGKCIS